jgi:hypothetical protein
MLPAPTVEAAAERKFPETFAPPPIVIEVPEYQYTFVACAPLTRFTTTFAAIPRAAFVIITKTACEFPAASRVIVPVTSMAAEEAVP